MPLRPSPNPARVARGRRNLFAPLMLSAAASSAGCDGRPIRAPHPNAAKHAAHATDAKLAHAFPAFARPPRASDRWRRSRIDGNPVQSSREIATLTRPGHTSQQLFLVDGASEVSHDRPQPALTRRRFFSSAPFEVIDEATTVAGVVARPVAAVTLTTARETVPVPLNADHGFIFACPSSCFGDRLAGFATDGHTLFNVKL